MEKRDLYDENKQKTGEVIEKGQKAYVEFSSDKDFLYVKTDIQWYEIKE